MTPPRIDSRRLLADARESFYLAAGCAVVASIWLAAGVYQVGDALIVRARERFAGA